MVRQMHFCLCCCNRSNGSSSWRGLEAHERRYTTFDVTLRQAHQSWISGKGGIKALKFSVHATTIYMKGQFCWWRRGEIFWIGKFCHIDLPFCRNSLIASLKERMVINFKSLLLHGNEDFRELKLDWEEKKGKKKVLSAYGTKRKSNFSKTWYEL